jgi:predicted nucleic acid-binding protein
VAEAAAVVDRALVKAPDAADLLLAKAELIFNTALFTNNAEMLPVSHISHQSL